VAATGRPRWWRWRGAQTPHSAVRSSTQGPVLVGVPVRI
jgi:hypothetical protein